MMLVGRGAATDRRRRRPNNAPSSADGWQWALLTAREALREDRADSDRIMRLATALDDSAPVKSWTRAESTLVVKAVFECVDAAAELGPDLLSPRLSRRLVNRQAEALQMARLEPESCIDVSELERCCLGTAGAMVVLFDSHPVVGPAAEAARRVRYDELRARCREQLSELADARAPDSHGIAALRIVADVLRTCGSQEAASLLSVADGPKPSLQKIERAAAKLRCSLSRGHVATERATAEPFDLWLCNWAENMLDEDRLLNERQAGPPDVNAVDSFRHVGLPGFMGAVERELRRQQPRSAWGLAIFVAAVAALITNAASAVVQALPDDPEPGDVLSHVAVDGTSAMVLNAALLAVVATVTVAVAVLDAHPVSPRDSARAERWSLSADLVGWLTAMLALTVSLMPMVGIMGGAHVTGANLAGSVIALGLAALGLQLTSGTRRWQRNRRLTRMSRERELTEVRERLIAYGADLAGPVNRTGAQLALAFWSFAPIMIFVAAVVAAWSPQAVSSGAPAILTVTLLCQLTGLSQFAELTAYVHRQRLSVHPDPFAVRTRVAVIASVYIFAALIAVFAWVSISPRSSAATMSVGSLAMLAVGSWWLWRGTSLAPRRPQAARRLAIGVQLRAHRRAQDEQSRGLPASLPVSDDVDRLMDRDQRLRWW